MCYHVSTPNRKRLKAELPGFDVQYNADEVFHASAFTRPFLPITTNAAPSSVEAGQWKLLPFWVKNEEQAKKYANTCNAVSEEVFEKTTYKDYIGKYRGLLWVDGFYEPHKTATGADENYYIYQLEKRIFSIGIVISPWLNEDTGELINTFSVLTTKANPLLERIHTQKKRMPLIIAEKDREGWLSAKGKKEITSFFTPYSGEFEAHKVYRVTADRTGNTNRPDIQDKIG